MQKQNIFEIVSYTVALIRSEERKRCTELRIQLVHFEMLNYLAHSNKYTDTPAATASYFGMTRGTVSQSLILLEKKGYIEKRKDENDKRVTHVKLLPSGQAILKKARKTDLFNKATLLLKKATLVPTQSNIFFDVLISLEKITQSPSFKIQQIKKYGVMKSSTIFNLIEYIAALIRSEERKRCAELKLQLVHFQILKYLSLCNKYSDTSAAITNYLGLTRGTVSQSLILLEKRDLIKKNQDQMDKRVFHIQLLKIGINTLIKAKKIDLFDKITTILEKNS